MEINKERDIKSMTLPELKQSLAHLTVDGKPIPAYRAGQLCHWLHVSMIRSFDECTNIPKDLRSVLGENYDLVTLREIDRQISRIDGTQKFLFALPDNNLVESVFMRYKFGNSVCVSSQVGCRMGCRFCASTLNGWERNLTPSEILDQVYAISRATGESISHVVIMGTGEPLDNYKNVIRFIRLLTDENGRNLSQRSVTLSTCGIVPRIYDLSREGLEITLAISLHATTDEKRRKIMPVAEKYTIAELMQAVRAYYTATGRQVTFEYSLIRDVNDSEKDARELAALAHPIRAHVNLIPVNPVAERGFKEPTNEAARSFAGKLEKSGIHVTIRREMGRDIDGACGQLRRRHLSSGDSGLSSS